MRIQTKISSIVFILILVTGVVATTTGYFVSKQMIELEIYHHLESNAIAKAYHIETLLDEEVKLVKTFAMDTAFIDIFTTKNLTQAIQKIKTFIALSDDISRVRVLDKQGNVVVSSHTKIDHVGNAEIFTNGKKGIYIRDVHISTMTGTKVISISVPILIKNEFAGIVIVNVEIEKELYKILLQKHKKTEEMYLINKDGYMISPSRFQENTFLSQKVNSSKAKECFTLSDEKHEIEHAKMDIYEDYRGIQVMGTHRTLKSMDWCLLAEIDAEEAFAPVNKLVQLMLQFFLLLFGVSSIVAFFIAKNITRPIQKLQRQAKEIGKGNWNYQETIYAQDEIGELSNTFDNMTALLKNAQDGLERQVAERTSELSQRIQEIEQQKLGMTNLAMVLEKSQQRYESLVNSIDGVVWEADAKTFQFQFVSQHAQRILGYPLTDWLSKPTFWADHIHPDDREKAIEYCVNKTKYLQNHSFEYRMITADNRIVWLRNLVTVVVENEQAVKLYGVMFDITERKRAEQAVHESEENLHTFFNTIDDLLFVLDEEGNITKINDTVVNRLGYSENELIGQNVLVVHPKEKWHQVTQTIQNMLAGKEEYCPIPLITKDGKYLPVETYVQCGKWSGKDVLFGVCKDISAIKISEEKFAAAFQMSPSLMAISTLEDGCFLDVNNSFSKILGYEKEEVIGKTSTELGFITKEYRDELKQRIKTEGFIHDVEMSVQSKKGHLRYGLFSIEFIELQNQKCLLSVMSDITERKQAEEAVQKERDKLISILNAMPNGIYIVNKQYDIEYTNPAVIKEFGSIDGQKCYSYFHERENVCPWCKNEQVFAGESVRWEWYSFKNNKYYDLFDTPIQNADGSTSKFEIFHDITKRKQAEEASRRFRAALDNSADAIFIIDRQTMKFVDMNKMACESVGYSHDELLSMGPQDIKPYFTKTRLAAKFDKIIHSQHQGIVETIHQRKDGTEFPVEILLQSLKFNDGYLLISSVRDITERKQMENILKESEIKYRDLVETSNDLIWKFDVNGVFTFLNASWENQLGYTPEEMLGKPFSNFQPPEQAAKDIVKVKEILTTGIELVNYDSIVLSKSGQVLNLLVNARVQRDLAGNICGVQGTASDITERKQAEENLKTSERKWQFALEGSQDGIWDWNVVTNEVYFSSMWKKMLGFADDEINGDLKEWDKLIHPDDKEQAYIDVNNHLAGETEYYHNEQRLLCKDGTYKWILDRGKVIEFTKEGKPLRFVGTHSDISDRKQMEETLKASEERFRSLVESTSDWIWEIDDQGNFTYASPRIKDILGYTPDEIVGKMTGFDLMPPEEAQKIQAKYESYVSTTMPFEHMVNVNIHKNGEQVIMESSGRPFFDESGKFLGYRGIDRDITERKKMEEHLCQAKESAEAANRAKSEFLANMSHEIRTPMNAVIGFSDILASKITDKKHKSYLNSIQTGGKTLLTLINDILDLSKIEAGRLDIQYEPVNPQQIFTELQQIFSLKIAEKHLELIMEVDETLPLALFLDETRLRQVLLNLIGNAIKFTDSGYIKLCANKIYTGDDHSKVNLIMAVEDSGIGVPADQQTLIFESFKQQEGQSNRKYGGTGLGLAITKRLVEMMNGHIFVESSPGKGSRFEIVLHEVKVAATQSTAMQDNTFDPNQITFEKVCVLVVDDIESNRDLIKEYLSQVNLEVIYAENGQQALLFVEEYHPALILMDIRMPEMDGYEATKRLKNNPITANIPVIALTASVALDEKAKIETRGFDGYLSKPVNISDLLGELSHYLKHTKKAGTDTPKVVIEKVDNTINPAEIANLPELQNQIRQEVRPLLKEVESAMEMGMVAELAEKMIQLGKEYNIPAFIQYGEPLKESSETFEISNIQTALERLPALLRIINH
jgi:PAS domain S-box-containing protein